MHSEHVKIGDVEKDIEKVYKTFDKYVADVRLSDRNTLRFRLLTEEAIRLAKSIIGETTVDMQFEGDSRLSYIIMTADNNINYRKQKELISVSSTGVNSIEKGFFYKLTSLFVNDPIKETRWSLKAYQDELMKKKLEDKYSEEAWDDLERSLVANLADDIDVRIDKNKIKIVITKDFSEALSTIGSRVPEIRSGQIVINSDTVQETNAFGRAEEMIDELELSSKDKLHMNLIFEETIGMLKGMTEDYSAVIWFEKYKNQSCLKLTAKTDMNMEKKKDILGTASMGENAAVRGFMSKVIDVIENCVHVYNNAVKLQQEYNADIVPYSMGMYGDIKGMAGYGVTWSLNEYKNSLDENRENSEEAQKAWDELEKSIVVNLAQDVVVGIKGNRVDMTVVYDHCI